MKLKVILVLLISLKLSLSIIIFRDQLMKTKKPVISLQNPVPDKIKKGRITQGYIADTGSQFLPFFTLLYVRSVTSTYTMCAGSIIAERYVLTAGHCFSDASAEVYVLAGFNGSKIESYTFFDQIQMTNVIKHPQYNTTTVRNDIAIIKLTKNLDYGVLIQKIKLPSSQSNFFNKSGIVSGFGVYSDNSTQVSNSMRYTFVTVTNGSACTTAYGATFFDGNYQLCIDTKGGHSSCSGDSGGALGIFENNILTIAGIVSFGSDRGCELGHPEVYTRVSAYLTWINNITGIAVS